MFIVWCVALIACGVLAASSFIVQRQPNAKDLIDKMVPFQGILGIVVGIGGLWQTFGMLRSISLARIAPLSYTIFLSMTLTMVLLGFLLGYGLVNQYVLSRNAQAAEQGVLIQRKLVAVQVPLGLIGIALGVATLALHFIH